MPNKKFLTYIKALILGLFVATEFFGFAFVPVAQAGNCTATINFNPVAGTGDKANIITLNGEVTLSNLTVIAQEQSVCVPSQSTTGYHSIHVGFNKGGNIQSGVAPSILKDFLANTNSTFTFKFSEDTNVSATGATSGQTVSLQACVFPTSSSGDETFLICSSLTPVVIGGAQPATVPPLDAGAPASTNCTGPNSDKTNCLYNPLPEDSLTGTLLLITRGFLGVIGLWAVAFIVFGGFQLVMAAGNEETVLKAKKTITWAVIGLIVALLAFSIIAIVQNLLNATVQPVKLGQEIKNEDI